MEYSPKEQALLEKENQNLLRELESDIDQVVQATQALQEIAQLQSTLSRHLSIQQENIENLHQEALDSVSFVNQANQQLKKTQMYYGQPRWWIFIFLIVASSVLLFLDYYG